MGNFSPETKADDGYIWLIIIKGPVNITDMLRWMLFTHSAEHLQLQQTIVIKVKAFRFEPSLPSDGPRVPSIQTCPMTIDAEQLDGGVVQGRIVPGGCRIM